MLSFVCGIVIEVTVEYFLIQASQISWKYIKRLYHNHRYLKAVVPCRRYSWRKRLSYQSM
jgi:hypothetical protein